MIRRCSITLTIHEQRYSVREQECLAIIFVIKKFRPFLERKTLLIYPDHSSLQWILNAKDYVSARVWRWIMFLQSYQFEVIHVAGTNNSAADALSCRSIIPSVQAIQETSLSPQFDWFKAQSEDSDTVEIINNVQQHVSFSVIDNLLYKSLPRKNSVHSKNLCLVVSQVYTQTVCQQYHNSSLRGHFGLL
ncbi:hypothetical protein G6F37_013057 [Rhizopus arrhizus]|nr:hypothetical protein G6F38_012998 [Rhizopus arrhizus]KAG1140014.1 hypothetical protein G6F37_013057 [Rhizopus arrhizus]